MNTSRLFWLTVPLSLTVALAACDKKPTGQIVAVVNGEEISQSELNQEIQGANIPAGADKKAVMRDVLQRVIDRRLLAQAAKDQGIDRDPAYVSMQRRMSEELLVQMSAKKASDSIKVPDAAAIDKFVSENPAMFGQRMKLKLDQIAFEMPRNPEALKQFSNDHSLEAVAATLTRLNMKYQRGAGAVDTGTIAAPMLKQIEALPPGEPFIVPVQGKVVASVITGREPIALTPEQIRPLAVESIRSKELSGIGTSRIKDARTKAKIEYAPDFAPKAAPPAPAAPTK